ncbi:Hypothetical protein R9X50_00141300 [Acrodontium crateriforme]|uniref:CoA-transferase family III n=1 Tax=Acrodontium crateriforme TaxID=150365 RepID=A0AAQ3R7V8_9PEZI|nr:Hypothetical protein R9X50_00141300 [Acrodontium crateriforme]
MTVGLPTTEAFTNLNTFSNGMRIEGICLSNQATLDISSSAQSPNSLNFCIWIDMSRSNFTTANTIKYIWQGLGLPDAILQSANIPGEGLGVPSSFKIGHIAQASIALSALSAALLYSHKNGIPTPQVTVPLQHAVLEFKSERFLRIDGKPVPMPPPIGGLHRAADGYIRIHDAFPNHREGTKTLLGCPGPDDRDVIADKVSELPAVELENAGIDAHLAMAVLRSYEQWDALPHAAAVADFPILIRKIADGSPKSSFHLKPAADKCLRAIRVVEMSRVIAAPVAGKTLAAHGADVLWVTSPKLPDLPATDRDFARGKRTVSLDINENDDRQILDKLLTEADVFIQSYRPHSLGNKGLSPEPVVSKSKNGIVYASLSAYGPTGAWSERRGFDSLVQTCSGLNVSEAEHYGAGEASRVLPCQVLDHASGYFLATGINAALYKQATEGGSYEVSVSLAGTMKYLRSLAQYEGKSGFECDDFSAPEDISSDFLEVRESAFGSVSALKHSASVDGLAVGFEYMPKPLGSDQPVWLS